MRNEIDTPWPMRLAPEHARPHIPSALGAGLLVVASIVGAFVLAAVL